MRIKKEQVIEKEALHQLAIDIAIEIGAVKRCPVHSELYEGDTHIADAINLAEEKHSNASNENPFKNNSIVRLIVEVIIEYPAHECPVCVKMK